jgi:hypothetical protein
MWRDGIEVVTSGPVKSTTITRTDGAIVWPGRRTNANILLSDRDLPPGRASW